MKTVTISTKEIRNDLEGFLQKLKQGQTFQVIYRSKPLVTVVAKEDVDTYLAPDAGTPAAGRRSVHFVRQLPHRPRVFDPNKSFKDLYDETEEI